MASRSHLHLRSRRFAVRFLMLCLVQSVVVTYLVLGLTDAPQSGYFSVRATPSTNMASVDSAISSIWTGHPEISQVNLAGFACHCCPQSAPSPVAGETLKRRLMVERIVEDYQIGFNKTEIGELAQLIESESRQYKHDPRLLLAVILTESSFRKGNVSYQGAHGLMQIKPSVAVEVARRGGLDLDRTSLFDPAYNIRLGSHHLFELIMKYGDIRKGLVAYSMGETAMRDRLATNRTLPSQYVRKVMATYESLLERYPDA
jgi:hypothetical protein